MKERLMTFREAAERSGFSESFFYTNKSLGKLTLPVVKIGRAVRVKESEFLRWMEGDRGGKKDNAA